MTINENIRNRLQGIFTQGERWETDWEGQKTIKFQIRRGYGEFSLCWDECRELHEILGPFNIEMEQDTTTDDRCSCGGCYLEYYPVTYFIITSQEFSIPSQETT